MKPEKAITVIVKEPEKHPYVQLVDNTLEALQGLVGGYIETLTIASDAVLICNEEGRIRGLPFNKTLGGIDFYGTVVLAGKKDDNFASLKSAVVPYLLKSLD